MKYNEKQMIIIPTDQVYTCGGRCKTFKSITELAKFFGISKQRVYKILERQAKKSTAYQGFYFDYLEA